MSRYEYATLTTAMYVQHRNGVMWADAAAPPKRHKHRWQTRAWYGGEYALTYLERCACGAASEGDDWFFIGNDKPRVAPSRHWWQR